MRVLRVACLVFQSRMSERESARQELAEACLRWTPQIALAPHAIFLEVGKCAALYSEASLLPRIRVLERRFGCSLRVAFGPDPASALALAIWGGASSDQEKVHELPIEAICQYADPFGLDPEGLLHSAEKMATVLRKLGVTTLGAFRALPAASIPSRFGKQGALVRQRVFEAASLPWPRFVPTERLGEKTSFETSEVFEDLEPALFTLKPMLERLFSRLRGQDRRLSCLRVVFHLEKYKNARLSCLEWKVRFSQPQGSPAGVIPVLRERLGFDLQRSPLSARVADLELEVLETAPGRGAQRDFFSASEQELEAWSGLVARLAEKLGPGRVFSAGLVERYRPEAAWKRKPPPEEFRRGSTEAPACFPSRPLRMLARPEPLDASGVMELEGPEILSGEWWHGGFERFYYKISTDAGELLWAYREREGGELFVHGRFD